MIAERGKVMTTIHDELTIDYRLSIYREGRQMNEEGCYVVSRSGDPRFDAFTLAYAVFFFVG